MQESPNRFCLLWILNILIVSMETNFFVHLSAVFLDYGRDLIGKIIDLVCVGIRPFLLLIACEVENCVYETVSSGWI